MSHLIIKNVGAIKSIDVQLNKINVIMGPQSSGKSTINKIACFCSWVEKKVSLTQSFDFFLKEDAFAKNLIVFHKLNGYLRNDSFIQYESPVVKFSYRHEEGVPHFEWIDQYNYVRPKISYIPAERNIVSMIMGWKEVNLPNNNIRNFMSDWNSARKNYTPDSHAAIRNLDVEYYYDSDVDTDLIETKDGAKINLTNASSGQQSMIPLYILVDYFTRVIYDTQPDESIDATQQKARLARALISKSVLEVTQDEDIAKDPNKISEYLETLKFPTKKEFLTKELEATEGWQFLESFIQYLQHYTYTNYSSLFIEEPELNLFPQTQCNLLYYILTAMQSSEKDHQLFLTTHSPYVLYALNNCMLAWLVKDTMPEDELKELTCYASQINPSLISVWELKDGELHRSANNKNHTIQNEDGLISKNYFDENMKGIMDDFYKMLNYYGDTEDED